MDMAEAQSWAVVIAAVGAAAGMVVNHWRVGRVQAQNKTIEDKVDVVHELTNSRLSRLDGQLESALAELRILRAVSAEAEKARIALAAAVVPSPPIILP